MKKHIIKILYAIAIIGLVCTLIIATNDLYTPLLYKLVVGYIIYLFLFSLYLVTLTIINIKNLKWNQLKPRLTRFFICFLVLNLFDFILYLFHHPAGLPNIVKDVGTSAAFAVGCGFLDLIGEKKKEEIG